MLPVSNPHVLAYLRTHPRAAPVLVLANFSDSAESVPAELLGDGGLTDPVHLHSTAGRLDLRDGQVHLPAWGHLWVTTR